MHNRLYTKYTPRTLKPAVCVMFLGLAACTTTPEQPELAPLLFPPPPEQARLVFERTVLGTGDLRKAEDSTTRLRRLVTGETASGRRFVKPFDVAVCKGHMFVSDTTIRSIIAFDIPGRETYEIGADEPGMLRKPLGVNVDEACNLYVVDATLKTVMKYRKDGTFIAALGGKDWFDRPSHVAASPDGARVYAVDTGGVDSQNHRIRVFDTQSGEHLYDIGTRGKETGQFNLPRDIEMGDDGRLYIVDGANFRVQVLEQDGTPVLAFGGIGRQFGQFSRPKGIGIDPNGNIYVSDATFGNFQIFNTEGQLLLFVGGRSTTPARAQYMLPAGLHVDEDGRVYMVDQFFRKIDIFRPAALAQDDGYLGAWYRSPEASDSGNK